MNRYIPSFRANLAWKLFIIVGLAALVIGLGSALIVRGAPASSTTYACVSRYTNQMRWVPSAGKCSSGEFGISWNSFDGANLDAAYVNEGQLDSITSSMIVDGEVMNADLGADSVTTDKILDGTVNSDDLGTGSVGSDEVIDDSLTAADLGTGSVGSDEVIDNSLTSDDLGTDSVNSDEIATSAVGSDEVLDNSLTSDDLGTGSVGSDEVIDNSLTSDDLGTGSVTTDEILDGTIQSLDLSAALLDSIDDQTLEGYVRLSNTVSVSALGSLIVTSSCTPDKKAISGGADVTDTSFMHIAESYPSSDTAWVTTVTNTDTVAHNATFYVVCMGP